jgi:ribonuclease P protein component
MTGPRIDRLTRRPEFLAVAASGLRYATSSVVVQALPPAGSPALPPAGSPAPPRASARFGFTATRKLGGAVIRNRARRRLKAAAALLAPDHARAGTDYVFVARGGALDRPWQDLLRDVAQAMDRAPSTRRQRR